MKWMIISFAVLLVGVGAFFVFNSLADESSEDAGVESASENTSFNQLLASGENARCTYDYTDESGNRSYGTAYFSGDDRMYGDFTNVSAEGTTNQAYVVRNGDIQYVWQAGSNEGFKTDVSQSTEETQTETSQNLDPDQNYEFKCVSWTVDESLFELPNDVEFVDIAEQLQQVQEQTQNAIENVCSQISDPTARAACEASVPN